MNERDITAKRDEVLFAFHQAFERPNAQQIVEWIERYPEFADDIRDHAAIMLDWAHGAEGSELKADATMIARGRSRALNAIYVAQRAAGAANSSAANAFHDLVARAGTTIPQLALDIDIDRMVLAELANGRVKGPIGTRLLAALCGPLKIAIDALQQLLAKLTLTPQLGHAKAEGNPTINLQSYEDVIRASTMPEHRKRYWLGED